MKALCGANCAECPSREMCKGCAETRGCPFGKQCSIAEFILAEGETAWLSLKKSLIDEINALNIEGMDKVTELYPLVGRFVNLEYPLPNGNYVKFLKDDEMYLGVQVTDLLDESKKTCFGVIAGKGFLLICKYGEGCVNPEIVVYKKR